MGGRGRERIGMLAARAQKTDHRRFECGGGDVAHWALRVGAFLVGVAAGVITVGLAVGIEFAAGVGDHRPAAAAAVRHALEQMKITRIRLEKLLSS